MRASENDELGIGIACGSGARADAAAAGYDFVERPPRARIASLPENGATGRLVLSGDWLPVGGSCELDSGLLTLLQNNVARLHPAYVVERLGFNRFPAGRGTRATGAPLPPAHTLDGVAVAVRRIVALRERLGVPVAFEIGANYLRKGAHELSDAAFVAAVALHAECGIVLDLASVRANEANGRACATAFLEGLPLEHVWEVQVSGTTRSGRYILDMHDGLADAEIRRLAEHIVPRLPALRSLVYEVRPNSLCEVAARALREQREWLTAVWGMRGTTASETNAMRLPGLPQYAGARARVGTWERGIVAGAAGMTPLDERDADAFALLARLIASAREAAIAEGAELSLRLVAATLGRHAVADLLGRYCAQTCAEVFPADEALRFLRFAERERAEIPYLREVVALERAAARAHDAAAETAVHFPCEPTEIFRALLRHDRPYVSDRRPHVVHVGPRGIRIEGDYRQAG